MIRLDCFARLLLFLVLLAGLSSTACIMQHPVSGNVTPDGVRLDPNMLSLIRIQGQFQNRGMSAESVAASRVGTTSDVVGRSELLVLSPMKLIDQGILVQDSGLYGRAGAYGMFAEVAYRTATSGIERKATARLKVLVSLPEQVRKALAANIQATLSTSSMAAMPSERAWQIASDSYPSGIVLVVREVAVEVDEQVCRDFWRFFSVRLGLDQYSGGKLVWRGDHQVKSADLIYQSYISEARDRGPGMSSSGTLSFWTTQNCDEDLQIDPNNTMRSVYRLERTEPAKLDLLSEPTREFMEQLTKWKAKPLSSDIIKFINMYSCRGPKASQSCYSTRRQREIITRLIDDAATTLTGQFISRIPTNAPSPAEVPMKKGGNEAGAYQSSAVLPVRPLSPPQGGSSIAVPLRPVAPTQSSPEVKPSTP